MNAVDVIKAVDDGNITWTNVWWLPADVRQRAIDRLMFVMSAPTGAEIVLAAVLVGMEWLYWKEPLKK
jgi:hypothetical protein